MKIYLKQLCTKKNDQKMKSGNKTEVTKEYYPDGALRAIITEVYYSNDRTTVFGVKNGYIEVSNVKVSNVVCRDNQLLNK